MHMIKKIIKKIYAILRPIEYARKIGVKVGTNCKLESTNFGTEPYLIEIGNHVEITGNVEFLTHDGSTWLFRDEKRYRKVIRYGKIKVLDNCFIGFGSIILPGVTIGPNAIVGAGSVITKDVPAGKVVAGCPARVISDVADYREKCLKETPIYNENNYLNNKKNELLRILE